MGKNWTGPKGAAHDFSSCRGHGVVIGTCDAARERETSKELVNLLNQAIEEVYPDSQAEPEEEEEAPKEKESIENLLKAELNDVKQRKHRGTQNVVSIKTDVKGITLIKITRRKFCPIKLVNAIFDRVKREKAPCSRHVIRIIPLKHVFFPNEEELKATLKVAVTEGLTGMGLLSGSVETSEEPSSKRARVEDDADKVAPEEPRPSVEVPIPAVAKRVPYVVQFKSRNHNVLNKDMTVALTSEAFDTHGYGDFRNPEVVVMVEALKNLCGISWFKVGEIPDNFNIRKFQADIVELNSKPVSESVVESDKKNTDL